MPASPADSLARAPDRGTGRLEAGFAVLPTSNIERTCSVSFLKSGPWNSLPTKLPPGASTSAAISSARSNSASERI